MQINEGSDIQTPIIPMSSGRLGSWKAYAQVVKYAQVFLSKGKKKKAKGKNHQEGDSKQRAKMVTLSPGHLVTFVPS